MIANTMARVCLGGVIAALMSASCEKASAGGEKTKAAGEKPGAARSAQTGFSFAVYGDSRSMMYLPYKKDEEAEARKLMVDMFALVLPEKVAASTVTKDVKLIYEPFEVGERGVDRLGLSHVDAGVLQ